MQIPSKEAKRSQFISSKLLGRKREPVEIVREEPIESIMKEIDTETTIDRNEVIDTCEDLLAEKLRAFKRESMTQYLNYALTTTFPPQMTALDASQPWMVYWVANSLAVIEPSALDDELKHKIVNKLFSISPTKGPFGGGQGQLPHIAGTYAAINALALCDNIDNCWDSINRQAIYEWLLSLKQPDNSFATCIPVGETDTRGTYCALSVASMLNIMSEELTAGVAEYLQNCQTYEGGYGGTPLGDEAHGGYTFCAVASLLILRRSDLINIENLMEWCSARQFNEEMGLSGRNNKLVDGCYSFWVGATAAMIEGVLGVECVEKSALRRYILNCCQSDERPGFRDKPGKNPDFYHTNYVLLGLAYTESSFSYKDIEKADPFSLVSMSNADIENPTGLALISPIYGLPSSALTKFHHHFVDSKNDFTTNLSKLDI